MIQHIGNTQKQPSFRIECWKKKHLNVENSWCTPCSSILNQNPLNLLLHRIPPLFWTASDDLQLQLQNLIGFNLGSCNSQLPDPSRLLQPPDGQLSKSSLIPSHTGAEPRWLGGSAPRPPTSLEKLCQSDYKFFFFLFCDYNLNFFWDV